MVAYPTLQNKPQIDGDLLIIPNVIRSEFGGGFIAVSQNGRKPIIRELTIMQPLESDAEFVILEDFISDNVAGSFTIEYLDRDKTGTTLLTVIFNGPASYSTVGGASVMSMPIRESQ